MATASTSEPFSIRGFAARMRSTDAAKCWPFSGGGGAGELEPDPPPRLPPMELPPRSRWWAHEVLLDRARLAGGGAPCRDGGGDGGGGGFGEGTKRKGSRVSGGAERSKKRRRAAQFSPLLKHREKTSIPQSTSRLLQHVLRKGLPRKPKKSMTIHENVQEQERQGHTTIHENSLSKQQGRGMDSSTDTNSSLFRRKVPDYFVNKRRIEVSRSNYPLNPGCALAKHVAYTPKDDIFGDLPLLESSKILFRTGADELPTVIEDSFVTNQSEADIISDTVPLKLMPDSDIIVQMSPSLEALLKKEGNPEKESTCISLNYETRIHPSSAGCDGPLTQRSINMVKTCLGDIQLQSTDRPALGFHSVEEPNSCSRNPPQGCLHTNKNCCQGNENLGTSLAAVRTRNGATEKDRDALVNGKMNTDASGTMVPTNCHLFSSEGSGLSSAMPQGTVNTGTNTDGMSSCRSLPVQEFVPTSSTFGNLARNIHHESRETGNACTFLSTKDQGNWYSKLHPVCTPANIGLAFMKLPGLERMEISNSNTRIGENTNGLSMNTIRCQKQQLVNGVTHTMQGQEKIGFNDPQAGKKGLDGCGGQYAYHSHQSTMRLMGKTVSVCKRGEEQVSTMGKVWAGNSIIEEDNVSPISCQLPQKMFPCQDYVKQRAHVSQSSNVLPRIPNSTLSGVRSTMSDVQNPQWINSVSSSVHDHIWNSGSQFVRQTNKASMISANSKARHLDLHQQPQMSIPLNQHSHFTPASSIYRKDHSFMGPAVNQPSSFPQWVLNTSMQGKYQNSSLLAYNGPSSAPIHQLCQAPGSKLSSTSMISFHGYGTNNADCSNAYQVAQPALAANLGSNFISTSGPTCTGVLPNIDVRQDAASLGQRNKRPANVYNVSQQPTKREPVTDRQDLITPMATNMRNNSLGWSLNDAIDCRVLHFGNKMAGHGTQISGNENASFRVNSGSVQAVETMSRAVSLISGATKTMLTPGQSLNDHSKLIYSTKFSVDKGINSVAL